MAETKTALTWDLPLTAGTSGAVTLDQFDVDPDSIEAMRLAWKGRAVRPGTYWRLSRGGTLWMTDTPAERSDHGEADRQIRNRGGRVLIVGLGLGMIVHRALQNPNVEHVDVVELDPDVIRLVGPAYASDRCTIHEADAYEIKWPPGTRWSVAWFDIWPSLCEDNLPEMARLARSYGRRVDWQGFWGKELILDERRRTKDAWWRRD